MRSIGRKIVAYTLAATLCSTGLALSGPATAADYDRSYLDSDGPNGGDMLGDLVIVRPAIAGVTVIGVVVWIVSSPFTLIGGNAGESWGEMVAEPFAYTFSRPLGHMEQLTWSDMD
jgi:hypothetical protein